MLGEKKRFYILAQQISGNRVCIYALVCMYALCFKILGNSKLFWGYKKAHLGVLGLDKVRFKALHFFHPASFTLVCCDKVLESKEVKRIQDNWSIFEKSST